MPHLLDARGVTLAWAWGDVWRWRQGGQLRVQGLRADELDARLVRLDGGAANWQLGAPDAKNDTPAALALPRFGSLVMDQGRITWITRSLLWGFPDYTTAEVRADGLYLFARLRFGGGDNGVNAARLRNWLARL